MTRLTAELLRDLQGVQLPDYDRSKVVNGILHIGTGNFHRAHQAVYTDDILNQDARWGIVGASLFSRATRDRLKPQEFLYTICERAAAESMHRIVGSISDVLSLGDQRAELMATLSSPSIKIVTLTVTEKGYCHTVNGELDEGHPDIQHDLANIQASRSMPGVLAAGLQGRKAAGAGPLTIVSCDNLSGNGKVLQQVIQNITQLLDPALADWCESHLSFPETMVDRIVPQPTEEDRSEFRHARGVQDEALLITEHFRQWVIEDNFMTDRPPWEAAGVQIVQNVAQFEMVKLRMLNAAHSALAYFGLISGYDYIHEAMADETLASFADYLLRHEVMPMIDAPPSMDLEAYQQSVLERFRNPAIAYRTAQVATDGSVKLPQRIFPSLQAASEKGGRTGGLSLVAAAWLRCMTDMSIAAKFSDPASGLTDPGALLAAAGANREIAQIITSRFEQISQGDCRSEIQVAIAGQ